MTHPNGLQLFTFEIASSENLRFIPLCVRYHLDRQGLRISLDEWQQLAMDDRIQLASIPVAAKDEQTHAGHFTARLNASMRTHTGHLPEHSDAVREAFQAQYADAANIGEPGEEVLPDAVRAQCALATLAVPDDATWRVLSDFQRYALCKLSRKPRLNHDFVPAMNEFGLNPEA